MDDRCENCRWWAKPIFGDMGECTIIVPDEFRGMFAMRDGWCKHHRKADDGDQ